MSKQLANPLQALVAKAQKTLPKTTGVVDAYAERQRRLNYGRATTVVLADVSGSMESPAWGGRTKHALLREAIGEVMQRNRHELIAFSSGAELLLGAQYLPRPGGNTALHLGLQAARQRDPGRILLISDGEPDNEAASLAAVSDFGGVIDVLYIGPDANRAAIIFLQKLAKHGHGQYQSSDIARPGQPALTQTIRTLLLEGPK